MSQTDFEQTKGDKTLFLGSSYSVFQLTGSNKWLQTVKSIRVPALAAVANLEPTSDSVPSWLPWPGFDGDLTVFSNFREGSRL